MPMHILLTHQLDFLFSSLSVQFFLFDIFIKWKTRIVVLYLRKYSKFNEGSSYFLIDKNKNIKIQFDYSPDKPIIDTFTELNFSVQDL